MTPDAPSTLVWLAADSPSGARAEPTPDAAQRIALASWARAHDVELVPPTTAQPRALSVDADAAGRVDDLIDRAHDAISAQDAAGADRALDEADSLLRAHAELAQAAWLMAEVERARAMRWRRILPGDAQAADRASARAQALDGGRAAGAGEESSPQHLQAAVARYEAPVGEEVWVDGRLTPRAFAGLHAVRVTLDGAPVWASWVDAPPGTSSLTLEAPVAPPCSTRDTAGALLVDGVVRPGPVRCDRWVAASAGAEPGALRVALCEAGRCSPLLPWGPPQRWTWQPPHERATGRRWPAWGTWTLVGAGVAVAAGVGAAVLASGALQPGPAETRFVSGGLVRSQSP